MQVVRDTHFRLEEAGEGITEEEKQRYLDSARAIVQDVLDDAERAERLQSFIEQLQQIGSWLLTTNLLL